MSPTHQRRQRKQHRQPPTTPAPANTPEARTATGELKDTTQPLTSQTEVKTEPKTVEEPSTETKVETKAETETKADGKAPEAYALSSRST